MVIFWESVHSGEDNRDVSNLYVSARYFAYFVWNPNPLLPRISVYVSSLQRCGLSWRLDSDWHRGSQRERPNDHTTQSKDPSGPSCSLSFTTRKTIPMNLSELTWGDSTKDSMECISTSSMRGPKVVLFHSRCLRLLLSLPFCENVLPADILPASPWVHTGHHPKISLSEWWPPCHSVHWSWCIFLLNCSRYMTCYRWSYSYHVLLFPRM